MAFNNQGVTMKNLIFVMILSSASLLFAQNKTYGKMDPATAPNLKMADVLKTYEKYKGQPVAMTGSVKKVCEMSGCWFEMADGKDSVRITMKDYGFTVPKEILSKSVKVVGVMEQKELPAKVIKHYLKDEGRPQAEIDKVKQPQKVFEFVATGVEVL